MNISVYNYKSCISIQYLLANQNGALNSNVLTLNKAII